jgi:predicted nucleic acid-binding protein
VANSRLVIDANIVIRAIFGVRVRSLIERHCETTAFYIAQANLDEAIFYTAQLGEKRGISEAVRLAALDTLMTMIQIIPDDELLESRAQAIRRIARRDADDWPAVAAALLLDCPIWTEDADFFGSGIATWTSDTVEIYLLDSL